MYGFTPRRGGVPDGHALAGHSAAVRADAAPLPPSVVDHVVDHPVDRVDFVSDASPIIVRGPAPSPAPTLTARPLPSATDGAIDGAIDVSHPVDTPPPAALPSPPRRSFAPEVAASVLVPDVVAVTAVVLLSARTVLGASLVVASFLLARTALRAYRPRLHLSALDEVPRLVVASLVAIGAVLSVRILTLGTQHVAARSIGQIAVTATLSSVGTAYAFFLLRRRRRRRRDQLPSALIVGRSDVGLSVSKSLTSHPELGLRPVGVLGRHSPLLSGETIDEKFVHTPATLRTAIELSKASVVVLAFQYSAEEYMDAVIAAHQAGCALFVVPPAFELHHDTPDVDRVRGIPLIRLRPDPTQRAAWPGKRALDVIVSAVLLVIAAPVLTIAALAVLMESGRPILFRQVRIGLHGKPFELLKLRSLRPATTREGDVLWNIGSDSRVTPLGRFLRRSSLDELPQLWNVLKGQMSLVGPRPERPVFVERFTAEHDRYWARHRVPTGLTGLAQVNGLRGDTSIEERARYDNYYIANWSIWLDVKIVLMTVREVLGGRGR